MGMPTMERGAKFSPLSSEEVAYPKSIKSHCQSNLEGWGRGGPTGSQEDKARSTAGVDVPRAVQALGVSTNFELL
jgi:hypothetical protein